LRTSRDSPDRVRLLREAIIAALERCWEGKLPFHEREEALNCRS
jgi:hypothetical protein